MAFEFRQLTDDDYPILCDWWSWHRFSQPPKDYLPNNGLGGLMITKDGVNICAGFLFLNNSKIAWLEYIVSSYEYRASDRHEAIEMLIQRLCAAAKIHGYKAVFTSLKNQSLIKRYEAAGFTKGSNNTVEMVISL